MSGKPRAAFAKTSGCSRRWRSILQERHLGEGERTLEPSIERHVEERRLAEDQQSLATSVDAHLTEVGLAEDAAMLAAGGLTEVPTGVAAKHAVRPVGLHVVRHAAGEGKTKIGPLDRNGLRQAIILSENTAAGDGAQGAEVRGERPCRESDGECGVPVLTDPFARGIIVAIGAEVAELADAPDSKSGARKAMRVRLPPSAPFHFQP